MSKVKAKVDVMYSIRITRELDDELCRVAEARAEQDKCYPTLLGVRFEVAGKHQPLSAVQQSELIHDPDLKPNRPSTLKGDSERLSRAFIPFLNR